MIKKLYFLISLLALFGMQLLIYWVFYDVNNGLDFFYKEEIKKCKIENIIKVKFKNVRGEFNQIQTHCGVFPILITDYTHDYIIKKGAYISKKAENNKFEITSNDSKHTFTLHSFKDSEMQIRIVFLISAIIVTVITYHALFIKK